MKGIDEIVIVNPWLRGAEYNSASVALNIWGINPEEHGISFQNINYTNKWELCNYFSIFYKTFLRDIRYICIGHHNFN